MDELDLTTLTDAQLLEYCNLQMSDVEQSELSNLLTQNRENQLSTEGGQRLEVLMQIYRRGLIRKGEAIKIAVERRLIQSLSQNL